MLTDFLNPFANRLSHKFTTNSCLNIPPHLKHQSAYRPFHSETAVLSVHNDLVRAVDDCRFSRLSWYCWISVQRSIRWTTRSCCACCLTALLSAALHWTGSSPTWVTGLSHSSTPVTPQPIFQSPAVYLRRPCLDPWVSSPTLTTSQPCLRSTASILTCTQTTHSSTTAAHSSTPSLCETAWPAVSLKSPTDARRADFSD